MTFRASNLAISPFFSFPQPRVSAALFHLPHDVWDRILLYATLTEREDKRQGYFAQERIQHPPSRRYHRFKEHAGPWRKASNAIDITLQHFSHIRVNPSDWNLRIVCKDWNKLLIPHLFRRLCLSNLPSEFSRHVSILTLPFGSQTYGELVRALVVDKRPSRERDRVRSREAPTEFSLYELLHVCPRVEEVNLREFRTQLWIPNSPLARLSLANIKQIYLWAAVSNASSLLAFACALPCLELLDLTAAGDTFLGSSRLSSIGGEKRLRSLTHLSVDVTRSRSSWLVPLAQCDMPLLKHLYVRVSCETQVTASAAFVNAHGTKLKSLVLSSGGVPFYDEPHLEILAHCPNLEEFITPLPATLFWFRAHRTGQTETRSLPRLPYLRVLGGSGYLTVPLDDPDIDPIPFRTKFTADKAPSLRILRALEFGKGPEQPDSKTIDSLARIAEVFRDSRGVVIEDALGGWINPNQGELRWHTMLLGHGARKTISRDPRLR